MKISIKILCVFILSVFILSPTKIEARSGCCSHHGGVCGCGCCDGSSLSSKCAPYYPECNSNLNITAPHIQPTVRSIAVPTKTIKRISTRIPTRIPTATLIPTKVPTITLTPSPTVTPTNTPTPHITSPTPTTKIETQTSNAYKTKKDVGFINFLKGLFKKN